MTVLSWLVILVGVLCLVDLLLTFGVIRRLRVHTGLLNSSATANETVIGLPAGATPPDFAAVSIRDEQVDGPVGLRVVAFFASFCSVCPTKVPAFLAYLERNQIRQDEVLAVMAADPQDPVPYLNQVAQVALVCMEPANGPVSSAFQVSAFPSFCVLDPDGSLRSAHYDPASLPVPAMA
jgi:AhpC/TSA family